MTVKLDLNPEVEAGLVAQAKAREFRAFAKGHRPVGSLTDESLRREHLIRDAS